MNRQSAGKRRYRKKIVRKSSRKRSKVSKRRSKCNKKSSKKSCNRKSNGKKRCSWVKRRSKGKRKSKSYCRKMSGGSYYYTRDYSHLNTTLPERTYYITVNGQVYNGILAKSSLYDNIIRIFEDNIDDINRKGLGNWIMEYINDDVYDQVYLYSTHNSSLYKLSKTSPLPLNTIHY